MALSKNDREVLLGALIEEYLDETEIVQFVDGKEFPFGKNLTFPEFVKWVRITSMNRYEEVMNKINEKEDPKTSERIEDFTRSLKDETILLKDLVPGDYKKIVVRNIRGFNSDKRSHDTESNSLGNWIGLKPSEMTKKEKTVYLGHQGVISSKVDDQTTVKDLVRLILFVKGSRFDRWYEMFSSVHPRIEGDSAYFDIVFDHGS